MDLDKILLVDIGNSNINLQIDNIYTTIAVNIAVNDFDKKLLPKHNKSLISCVANFELIDNFNNPKIVEKLPYKNINFAYDLGQLGVDRYLAIIAGFNIFPNTNFVVIDVGTAITIDKIVGDNHTSIGIIPGLEKLKNTFDFKGNASKNTFANACSDMLKIYLEKIITEHKNYKILITGGNQNLLKITNENISYHQNLTLDGMQQL
jgi:pantothenate kinase type III